MPLYVPMRVYMLVNFGDKRLLFWWRKVERKAKKVWNNLNRIKKCVYCCRLHLTLPEVLQDLCLTMSYALVTFPGRVTPPFSHPVRFKPCNNIWRKISWSYNFLNVFLKRIGKQFSFNKILPNKRFLRNVRRGFSESNGSELDDKENGVLKVTV